MEIVISRIGFLVFVFLFVVTGHAQNDTVLDADTDNVLEIDVLPTEIVPLEIERQEDFFEEIRDENGVVMDIPFNTNLRRFNEKLPDSGEVFLDKRYLQITVSDASSSNLFPARTVSPGHHVVNINNARRVSFRFYFQTDGIASHLRIIEDNGKEYLRPLSGNTGTVVYGHANVDHQRLLHSYCFTVIDSVGNQHTEPITLTLRDLRHVNAVREDGIAKMRPNLACSNDDSEIFTAESKIWCINNFNYKQYIWDYGQWTLAFNYSNWSSNDKYLFFEYLSKLEKRGYLDFLADLPGANYQRGVKNSWFEKCSITLDKVAAKNVSLLYAAHSVFTEVNGKTNWAVENLSYELLQTLFHPSYIFWEQKVDGNPGYYSVRFINLSPNNQRDWAIKTFNAKDQREALLGSTRWVGRNVKHAAYNNNPVCLQYFSDFMQRSDKVSSGCGQTSQFIAATARALNIPAITLKFGHRSVYFPQQKLGFTHGDDPYDIGSASIDYIHTPLTFGMQNAMSWYGSVDERTARSNKREIAFDGYANLFTSSNARIGLLNTQKNSSYLGRACYGYQDFQDWMSYFKKTNGKGETDRLYCCVLNHKDKWYRLAQGYSCKSPPANLNCGQITKNNSLCGDVQFISDQDYAQGKFNEVKPGSPEAYRMRSGIELPKEFKDRVLIQDPNYVPHIDRLNGNSAVPAWSKDQFKRINRFILDNKATKVYKPWS